MKLTEGEEESKAVIAHLPDYRRIGETFTPLPVIGKDEYGTTLIFFKPGQYVPVNAPDSNLIFYVIEGRERPPVEPSLVCCVFHVKVSLNTQPYGRPPSKK
ncbi:hypothetical protein L3N51_00505 [Metallosphaera sp. J1]|uniref:hypothetical protein n=1 Tax=Metallosphaera javensis (ex Hofmann et al. 2022) TaxID=99938 RepID=UPI001EDE239D|nr:hypothetical protein [Metallosphaera javensis (ex Hofmann et al. 2022)]MCG3108224.1 hypothetical protein [Metallosphaera javensis (ex Hofmann et al. 2022)]